MSKGGDLLEEFLLGDASDGAIGFDGMGAVDIEKSDLEIKMLQNFGPNSYLKEAHIKLKSAPPQIFMRRAVKEFDLIYDSSYNLLLISEKLYEDSSIVFDRSITTAVDVICHFGNRVRKYLFANLRHYRCRKSCINWSKSTFIKVNSSSFHINRTRVGRGQVDLNHEAHREAEGLIFDDSNHYAEAVKQSYIHWIIPQTLTLNINEPCGIINLSSAQTLFCDTLVQKLRTTPRPKSKVPGIVFSNPSIPVCFL